ncbi:MAG: hypothetical protein HN348_10170 [Proteobacteria bacterium]|jgi:dolichol kinase|nr:hypothetical protein [Pseudomonadota bacterium]
MPIGFVNSSQTEEFARECYSFLAALDPATMREDAVSAMRDTLEGLHDAGQQAYDAWEAVPPRSDCEERARATFEAIKSALPNPELIGDARREWFEIRDSLTPLYEAMATSLKQTGASVDHLHPTNHLRVAFHMSSGFLCLVLFEHILNYQWALVASAAWLVWAWTLEITRRYYPTWNDFLMTIFGPFARDHERYRINSATWFGTAIFILLITSPPMIAVLAVLVLAIGDPVAAMVGRRWGKHRVFGHKSIEGTLGFTVACMAVGMTYLTIYYWDIGFLAIVVLATVAAVVGAIVELLSTRLEDNLMVPIISAWVTSLVWWLAF